MDRAERKGLTLAIVGHVLLFAILSLNLMMRAHKPLPPEAMDVQLVDKVGLKSAAPEPSQEPPAESQAPEKAPPAETPPPPAPTPEPKPAPPAPKPEPLPAPKPTPAKPVPAKAEPKPTPPREKLSSDILKGITAEKQTKATKATGARLGADFLKGLTPEKTAGKGKAPRAALTGPQVASIGAAIVAQIKPCYNVPAGGAGSDLIVTELRLRFNRDGSLAARPEVSDHQGVTAENRAYVQQMDDAAVRAVIRCAPLHLPPDLYDGGWQDIIPSFRPRDLG